MTDPAAQPVPIKLAVVANAVPPYRAHVHRRITRELAGRVRLWTLTTHEEDGRWKITSPDEIGLVSFANGDRVIDQPRPRNAPREWAKGERIIRWLRAQGFDRGRSAVVLIGYNDAGRLRLLRWCRRHDIPCFVWGDSNIADDKARGVKGVLKRLVVGRVTRWAAGMLACGSRGRDFFVKYGARLERIFLFTNEPDYALIRNLPPGRVEAVREKFALALDRRRLIYSGRLEAYKRVDLLIAAFSQIAAQRPEWDLLIAGDGTHGPSLRTQVPEELRGRVQFTGHIAEPADVFALLHLSDVLVLPSDHEPWALVINEAAAAGLAIVSSSVPGAAAELVREGVNGRIFPQGDLPALVECLLDVTRAGRVDEMKAASPGVLADWQRDADPVEGLCEALRSSGLSV